MLVFVVVGSVEHRAQVILYTLLMSDRYSHSVDAGLLYYMKTAHMLGVPGFLYEKRALVMKRNEVARYLTLNRAGTTGTMPGELCLYFVFLQRRISTTLNQNSVKSGTSNQRGRCEVFPSTNCLCTLFEAKSEVYKMVKPAINLEPPHLEPISLQSS